MYVHMELNLSMDLVLLDYLVLLNICSVVVHVVTPNQDI
jgi:hypothetical protein